MKGIRQKDAVYWTHNKSVACLKVNWRWIIDVSGEFLLYDREKDPSRLHHVKANFPEEVWQLTTSFERGRRKFPKIIT